MKAYFVSDIHLKDAGEPSAKTLERLLRSMLASRETVTSESATHLFLVGDIFDLWIGGHDYFRAKFETLIDLIRDLVRSGVEVHFFEGNHDLHLREFWTEELGVQVHEDAEYFELAPGQTIRVEHGDLMNLDDKGYLFLRKLLRLGPVRALALHLPSSVVAWIGERASRASRDYTSNTKSLARPVIQDVIRTHAKRAYQERPFKILISGHVHERDDFTFTAGDGEQVRSVNLGSWFDEARAFMITDTRAEFETL